MKTVKIKTATGKTIFLNEDGCWFRFASDDNMRLVVSPNNANYAYSHGGSEYQAAAEAIAAWKDANGWGSGD